MAYKCFICNLSDVNDLELGEFLECKDVHVHYFCLLLTTSLLQNGEDDEGILGFLIQDIRKCARGLKQNLCYICYKPYANIECGKSICKRKFHTLCGLNRCLNTFSGKFVSYCESHHQIPIKETHQKTESCLICYDSMNDFNPISSINPICCKCGWMHKKCLAHYAKTSGYFCKCPLCNNDKIFRDFLARRGIFIPDQDAAWELEPNAYSELLERPKICQASNCYAPRRDLRNNRNRMKTCSACGSYIAHIKCWNTGNNFICLNCTIINNNNHGDVEVNKSVGDQEVNLIKEDNCNGSNEKNVRYLERERCQSILLDSDSDDSCIFVVKKRERKNQINLSVHFDSPSEVRLSLDSSNLSTTSGTSRNSHNQNDHDNSIDKTPHYLRRSCRRTIFLDSDSDESQVEVRELRGRKIKINMRKNFNRHLENGNCSSTSPNYSIQCISRKSHEHVGHKNDKKLRKRKKKSLICMPVSDDLDDSATTDFSVDIDWDTSSRRSSQRNSSTHREGWDTSSNKRYRRSSRIKSSNYRVGYRSSINHGILTDISNDNGNSTNSNDAIFEGTSHQNRRDSTNTNQMTESENLNQMKMDMYFEKLTY